MEELFELFKLCFLVYEYGQHFKFSGSIDNAMKYEDINKLQVGNVQKEILRDLKYQKPDWHVHKFVNSNITGLQAVITVCEVRKRICVVFRGSESPTDWFYNLNLRKTRISSDVWVHKGFSAQLLDDGTYVTLESEVKLILMKFPGFSLYISGHSLGGALATLFGYLISDAIQTKVTVISFASPRVGGLNWKKRFESKSNLVHYRVTNNRDIVSIVPMINYFHVGNHVRLLCNGQLQERGHSWYSESFLSCWSFSDHKSESYYYRLKAMCSDI